MFKKRASRIGLVGILTLVLISIFSWETVFADLPQQIFFQARLKKKDRTTLSGSHSFIFRLYSASSGGSSLWSETQTLTADASGVISCYLGSSTAFPSTLDFNSTYYLSIEVDSDGEMSPRLKIVPSIASLNTDRFDGLNSTQFLRSDTADTMEAALTLTSYLDQDYTGTAADAVNINFNPASGSYDALDITYGSAGGTGTALKVTQSGSGDILGLYDGSTGVLSVKDGGNVGIGTTSPSTFKLEVAGNIGPSADSTYNLGSDSMHWANIYADTISGNITPSGFSAGGIVFGSSGGLLTQDASNLYWDDTNNYLGLGTTSPSGVLHSYISNAAVTSSKYTGYLENLATNTTTDGIDKYGLYITSTGTFTGSTGTATNNYGLYVNTPTGADNNYAAVFAGGNVGIGTTAPLQKLQVAGDINIETGSGIRINNTATSGEYLRGDGTRFVSSAIQATDLPGSFAGFANPTATLGLTATNGTATTAMRSDAAPALSQSIIPTWTGTHTFSNATYSALFTGGNVGIGTATPSTFKLEVAGNLGPSTPSTYNLGSDSVPWLNIYADSISSPTKGTANYLVAANDSPTAIKNIADYTCDGTADDVQINAALTALGSTGGIVYLAKGNYAISDTIKIPSNTTLAGAGNGTVLTLNDNVDKTMITNNADYTFEQRHATGNTNIVVRDMYIDGNKDGQGTGHDYIWCVGFNTVDNLVVENLTIIDGWTEVIRTEFCSYVTIANNRVHNSGDDGIAINQETYYASVYGNRITDSGQGAKTYGAPHGIEVQDGSHDVSVTANVIYNSLDYGIQVSTHAGRGSNYNISINSNTINNCNVGVQVAGISTASQEAVTVANNSIFNNSGSASYGIQLTYTEGAVVTGNTIKSDTYGIRISQTNTEAIVSNNYVVNTGTAPTDYVGLLISDTLTNCRIEGNIINNFGWKGIGLSGTLTRVSIVDNHITGCTHASGACVRWDSPTSTDCILDGNNLEGTHWSYDAATATWDVMASDWTVRSDDVLTVDRTNEYVGIGTTSPGTKLDVRGNVTISSGSDIRPTSNATNAINIAQADGTDFVTFDTTNKTVGIGTTGPDRKLDILDSTNPQLRLTQANESKYADFRVDSAGDLTITSNLGNLLKTDSVDFNLYLGRDAGYLYTAGEEQRNTFIGYQAGYNNDWTTGNEGRYNTYVGFKAGYGATTGVKNTGTQNVAIGDAALYYNTSGSYLFALGYGALAKNTSGIYNVALGSTALSNLQTGNDNVGIGGNALYNTTASGNLAVGRNALLTNAGGWYNVGIGGYTLYYQQNGHYNTAIGVKAGYGSAAHDKSNNVYIGYEAGYLNQGNANIFIGYQAAYNETGANKLYIENSNSATPLIYGEFDNDILAINGSLGIGTASPNSLLHVAGPVTTATATKTAAYTVTGSDSVIFADTTTAAFTVTLPAASASTIGRVYYIYKVDSAANAVTVAAAGTDTVNGAASVNTSTQWKCIRVIGYTATGWIANTI